MEVRDIKKIHLPDQDSIWYAEKQINVFDFLDFFPRDAIGTREKTGRKLTFDTDLGWSFESDILQGSFCLRNRSKSRNGTGRWVRELDFKPGDQICIEKISDYHYKLLKLKTDDN